MTAPLNWSKREPKFGQLTAASTTRDTTAPANTLEVAQGNASKQVTVPYINFRLIESLTERMLIWIWYSDDSGTTKRIIDEITIEPERAAPSNTVQGQAASWSRNYPLTGTAQRLYVSETVAKKTNWEAERVEW